MSYDVGDIAIVETELRDSDGTLTAAVVTITVVKPDGTVLTPEPTVVDNGGVGKYKASFALDVKGLWKYYWTSSGALIAVDGGEFTVSTTGSVAAAAAYIGASPDDALLAKLTSVAETMVDEYLSDGIGCPLNIRDHAITQLASELFSRRNNPGGVIWAPGGDSAQRLSRDPMLSVIPMLRSYASLGIA